MKQNLLMRLRLLCWLQVLALGLSSQSNLPSFITDSLDVYVNRSIKAWNLPGCAVAVIKDGKIVLAKGFGVRDLSTGLPVNEHSQFMIASNTKAVTGLVLAKLDAEKKLSLEDLVTQWLPKFKLSDKNATKMLTVKDLVTHRMGFETFLGDFCHWSTSTTREQVMEKMGRIKLPYPFRDKYGYCNAGYTVAGEIIRQSSGLNWEDYVRQNFFDPMDLQETLTLTAEFGKSGNFCQPHTWYKGNMVRMNIPNIDNMAPATSICTSVADWSKWVLMLLNEGQWEGKQILSKAVIQKTMEPYSIVGPGRSRYNRSNFSLYGLGWNLQDYEGRKLVSHTGGADGFVTSVTLVPQEKLGILVFTNSDHNGLYQAIKWEILDAFFGLAYRNYSEVYLQRKQKEQETTLSWLKNVNDTIQQKFPTAIPLKAYTGKYRNEVYGEMQIKLENGQLRAYFEHHPHQYAVLEHIKDDRFLCTYSNILLGIKVIPFFRKGKKVKSVDIRCDDFVDFSHYTFLKC